MCGINGIFCLQRTAPVERDLVVAMSDTLRHRGPDGEGHRVAAGYGLGHRRLAIVDLVSGAQPMGDAAGEVWVTFNGEIYNHEELRRELEAAGHRFRTRSDTEVLVYGYREWGTALASRLFGMFAFAIVDQRDHSLYLARDRMGQKPLYWMQHAGQVLFASEIKALLAVPGVPRRLDPVALGEYLCLSYVPDPRSIFADVHKLPPATWMLVRDGRFESREYWSPQLRAGASDGTTPSLHDQQQELLDRLDVAVRRRLMSDVPLGAFLSGGVDSFAVVDSMSRVGPGEVLACTVGFDVPEYDERVFARQAAQACRAHLFEDVLKVEDMLDLDWFTEVFDEPFADASAIPTYHVSRIARSHVTVALSGDGGDENFAGYRRYKFDAEENRLRRLLPGAAWRGLGALYPKLDFLPRWLRYKRTLQNLGCSPDEAYARSVSAALPEDVLPLLRPAWRADDPLGAVRAAHREAEGCHPLQRCALADRRTTLPGDILTKVDRASMAVSLEVRSPFLDHQLVEFAADLSYDRKLLDGASKGFLKEALVGRLGRQALNRPKRGFAVPLALWMRGSLGDALGAALADGPLGQLLEVERARRLLDEHRRGARDRSRILWALLVLHRFLNRWAG
ncbi:MAG: asparagine synthase (glutamine-hydrolyzing) [Planctomycetes bacterium]|nr:asparagine synthase (glutamine-hydrolyzing) [Planctomycetota bacterium]